MQKQDENKQAKTPAKPQETGVVHVTGHVKIYDPNTKEVFVDKRED